MKLEVRRVWMSAVVGFPIVVGLLALATEANAALDKVAFFSDRSGIFAIYLMDPDGSNVTFLTDNGGTGALDPAWSPDETKIAFDDGDDIWVMDADLTNAIQLTMAAGFDTAASWSPDGTKITFGSFRDGNTEVYVMNADGTNQTNLTNHPALDGDASWSPDGTQIVFHSRRTGTDEVHIMNADGTNPVRITPTTTWSASEAWSPDGTEIAFGSFGDVWVINPDGSGLTRLTTAPGADSAPSWSPDSQEILFHSNRDGNYEIYKMNADGSGQVRLTNHPAFDHRPTWAPDLAGPAIVCLGFESPMAAGPVTVKGNRALPLKAKLVSASGIELSDVDVAAAPILQVWYEYGTPAALDVTEDALPVGEGTEGDQFEFGSSKWQYNLKTGEYSAPGTYTVFMESGDSAEYTVEPTCVGLFVVK